MTIIQKNSSKGNLPKKNCGEVMICIALQEKVRGNSSIKQKNNEIHQWCLSTNLFDNNNKCSCFLFPNAKDKYF